MADSSVICVFSNKGGSGKTTIAVHLALAYAQLARTALLDVDPQATATEWLKRRPTDLKSPLAVPCAGRDAVERALRLARAEQFQFIILDLPPHSSAQIAWLLKEADLILVPTRPSAADLVTIRQTVDLVHAAKRRAGFILNAFRPQLVEAREIAPILAAYQLPIISSFGDRVAFSRGLPVGLGGHELGDPLAEAEVMKLAKQVSKARGELRPAATGRIEERVER
jgi:chromosome partitioning protein